MYEEFPVKVLGVVESHRREDIFTVYEEFPVKVLGVEESHRRKTSSQCTRSSR